MNRWRYVKILDDNHSRAMILFTFIRVDHMARFMAEFHYHMKGGDIHVSQKSGLFGKLVSGYSFRL